MSDFGLSKINDSLDTYSSSLNQTYSKRGTVKYCAPEMLDLEDAAGHGGRTGKWGSHGARGRGKATVARWRAWLWATGGASRRGNDAPGTAT